ncbi:MAG: NADH-quinone oxidoreductase subunit G [Rickettsiales bacterium]|jgi:NADH-quinone oxidoreductase subunit G|nr:NADH-quinone oxidoreductase subunit G [Rickettsiales bacterium]
MENKVTITVNDVDHEVPSGITLIQALEYAGHEIPRFCYHDRLSIAGNCRMCLVEMIGGPPKPLASCAASVSDGMKIRTDSEMVKKAREGVMEFLLINHPLDCPICDQGGECDLQDQALNYGKNVSNYKEIKRAVANKEFGPLISTNMTRCIHCTRCIRFAEEVAGTSDLGSIGRGEDMEVSTYVSKTIASEMSGNMIDLCPVGALTSKPYAFAARPWELIKTESIDVHDACGSNIRIDSMGSEVVRILPVLNEDINEEWISDKTRFAYDGLLQQRLDRPYVKVDGKFEEISWEKVMQVIAENIKAESSKKSSKVAALAGDLADVESVYLLKNVMQHLGSSNYDCRPPHSVMKMDNRSDYLLNTEIRDIEKADLCLLIGVNPRVEAAIINSRILKAVNHNNCVVGYVGDAVDLNYPYIDLGQNSTVLEAIASGEHEFNSKLKQAKNPIIILGEGALCRQDSNAIMKFAKIIAENYNIISDDVCNFNILQNAASRVGALDVGFYPDKSGLDTSDILRLGESGDISLLFLLGYDHADVAKVKNAITIYIGSHGDVGAQNADIILPATAYTEKNALYVNAEGRVQNTVKAVPSIGEAKEDWQILNDILASLTGKSYSSQKGLYEDLYAQYPHLANRDAVSKDLKISSYVGQLSNQAMKHFVANYYMTNPITRASSIMAKCAKEFIHNKAK